MSTDINNLRIDLHAGDRLRYKMTHNEKLDVIFVETPHRAVAVADCRGMRGLVCGDSAHDKLADTLADHGYEVERRGGES